MKSNITVTVVYDNNPLDERLKTAWGLACVVRGLSKTILFDTGGDGPILLSNMAKCRIRPEEIDLVVLSHIHGDHAGGLNTFLQVYPEVILYLPKAFPARFKKKSADAGVTVVETDEPRAVCEGAWTTGVLGNGIKEQGMYLTTPQGLVVITGCAHPGIVRMADAAGRHAEMPIHAVLGGFHLSGASRRRIVEVISGLKELGVLRVAPCHCSGKKTQRLMEDSFGDGYIPSGVGAQVGFGNRARQ